MKRKFKVLGGQIKKTKKNKRIIELVLNHRKFEMERSAECLWREETYALDDILYLFCYKVWIALEPEKV
jgi:hypothetical protein